MKPTKKPTEKEKPYKPTARDVDLVKDHMAAREKRGPRLKVTLEGNNMVRLGVHHADQLVGSLAIMHAIEPIISTFTMA